jgi:hypothetical protein
MPEKVPISATISRISAVEAEVPFSLWSVMAVLSAIIRATVVLPTPDGP